MRRTKRISLLSAVVVGLSFLTPSCSRHDRDTKLPRDSEILLHIAGTWNVLNRGYGDSIIEGKVVYTPNGEYASRCKWLYGNTARVDVIEGRYEIKNGFLLETITNMSRMRAGDSPPAAIFEHKVIRIDDHQLIISNESGMHSFDRKR